MNENVKVLAWDGYALAATHFKPTSPNGKVVLINSATGVGQVFYKEFASYMATQGFHVYTFDYRGIGLSRPKSMRSIKSNLYDWAVLDVDAIISYIMTCHGQMKLVIIGHCVGGQLIGLSRLSKKADAFVMIAAQTPFIGNYQSTWMRLKLNAFWNFILPILTSVTGYFPASRLGLSEDLPQNVAKQWARWAKTHHYAFDEHPEARANFSTLEQRTLAISFSDDKLAPRKAVDDLLNFFHRLRIDHWHFQPEEFLQKEVGHFGFFRKPMQPVIWAEVNRWINQNMSVIKPKAA
jgi:predicted alpha/beta hydrolase